MKKNLTFPLVLICALCFSVSVYPEPRFSRDVVIIASKGDVRIIPKGTSLGVKAEEGMVIHPGDWVRTGIGSYITLVFDKRGNKVVELQEDSLIIIKGDGYYNLQIMDGKLTAILENMEKNDYFRVLTPSAVAESNNSVWMVDSSGILTTVSSVSGYMGVYGVNTDGTAKDQRYEIVEGNARTTRMFEDPSDMMALGYGVVSWNRKEASKSKDIRDAGLKNVKIGEDTSFNDSQKKYIPEKISGDKPQEIKRKNVVIVDGKEVDIIEYMSNKNAYEKPAKK